MEVRALETIYEILCGTKIICGLELWGKDEAQKETQSSGSILEKSL
jgi:hypothetical protein